MKGVLRDVLGTFVELSPEEPKPPVAPTKAPPPAATVAPPAAATPAPAATPTAAAPAVEEGAPDPAIEGQVDEALGKVASQQLVEFLALYDNMAFIANASDRVRAALVAKSLPAQGVLDLFLPQLTAIGRIQSSFATTLGTKLAQADTLAQIRIGEADAAIAAAREQIAALETQIKEAEAAKASAAAGLEAAKAENTRLQRALERACDSRRAKLTDVQKVLAELGRTGAGAKP